MSVLWSGFGLVAPLRARILGALPSGVGGISIDTRTLAPGDLFFAIRGDNSDGHDYVRAAFEAGAGAAVIDEAHAGELKDLGPLYIVADTLKALENLGRASRARSYAGIAAITGSVGKTSTKEALALVLSRAGKTHASAASYNNHWGVPLTLARMPADAQFGIFEIGMNHPGEITPLVGMVQPHAAMVTRIAPAHLEYFKSLEDIAEAKAEIFSGLAPEGSAILNRDDGQFALLAQRAEEAGAGYVLSFGEHEEADARLLSYAPREEGGADIEARVFDEAFSFHLGAAGKHHAMNCLGVILMSSIFGVEPRDAAAALADYAAPAGRGRRETLATPEGEEIVLLDESYNANPVSMRAAFDLLAATRASRRIAILGDMLELGDGARDLHAGLAEDLQRAGVDLVFAAGPMMAALYEAIPEEMRGAYAQSAALLQEAALAAIRPGDAVMAKGSNGSRIGPLVKALREKFSAAA